MSHSALWKEGKQASLHSASKEKNLSASEVRGIKAGEAGGCVLVFQQSEQQGAWGVQPPRRALSKPFGTQKMIIRGEEAGKGGRGCVLVFQQSEQQGGWGVHPPTKL